MPLTLQNENLVQRKNLVSTAIEISLTLQPFFRLFFFSFFFTKENPSYSTAVEHYSSNLLHYKTENPVICQKI